MEMKSFVSGCDCFVSANKKITNIFEVNVLSKLGQLVKKTRLKILKLYR